MEIITTTEFKIKEKTAVAIGKFDGLHKGHRRLLDEILLAKKLGLKAAVFTFNPSPAVFFNPGGDVKELMTKQEKRMRLEELGVDYLVEYPFTKVTSMVEPREYILQFLIDKMNAGFIAAGEDVSYGAFGKGDAKLLCKTAKENQVQIRIIPKICYQDREISSTFVREAVSKGDMELACKLLGEHYSVSGMVKEGNKIGRTMGLPTVNLYPETEKLLPPNGVYFSTITYGQQLFYGVTNIGVKPTIKGQNQMGVETYIYDFNEDIYGKNITVSLYHYDRPEQKFDSIDKLKEAIELNVLGGRRYFDI